jgi:hypothetical protein
MRTYDDCEFVANNCTDCIYFISYAEDYYDDMEPEDQGFCRNNMQIDNYGDATITCELFEKR